MASLLSKGVGSDGRLIRANRRGLTDLGLKTAQEFIARGIWIDLSHASDESHRRLVPLMKEAGQPLLYTHTALRRYQGVERGITLEQLRDVGRTGGMVGLLPSPVFLQGTPAAEAGGVEAFVHQYNEAADRIGAEAVAVGSDFNGAVPHLRPTEGSRGLLGERGLWNIAQESALWLAMARSGARLPANLRSPIQRFLEAWRRVLK
jgi:microsomal dipeptidase-like Zn-dependent dipeptidase